MALRGSSGANSGAASRSRAAGDSTVRACGTAKVSSETARTDTAAREPVRDGMAFMTHLLPETTRSWIESRARAKTFTEHRACQAPRATQHGENRARFAIFDSCAHAACRPILRSCGLRESLGVPKREQIGPDRLGARACATRSTPSRRDSPGLR